jgi:hypothetical protein
MLGGGGDRGDQRLPLVGRGSFGGTIISGVVGLAAAVLTLAVAFFFGFPAGDLGAAVDLRSGFLGLAVILVAVTLGCSCASVTG